LLVYLLKHLQDQTLLCVATDLTSKTESIQTRTVAQWRKEMPSLHKRPTLFALFVA
jgi:16S rRNA (cytidine1402-2'-O)-methyltransferase